ncbi:glycoside hydrolase family 95 protein [Sunxiuqinia sp. A32]|uniref:glycoside hydrolase family 95 protein n=1 Tax=Sunxiuqinia sp. A32 TaxID=3461496 RepID=UPI0040464008
MKNVYLLFMIISLGACSVPQKDNVSLLKLWYEQPAELWTDALPLGNGRLGAMVFGGVSHEHIQFNEETLWTGEPQSYANEGASKYLEQIQQLLFEGKQDEAQQLAQEHFMSMPPQQRSYQPFGDLFIDFEGHENFNNYKRVLSLNQAVQKTTYKVGDTNYEREMLISKLDDLMAIKLSCDKSKALAFSFWIDAEHKEKSVSVGNSAISLDVAVADGLSNWFNHPYKSVLFGNAKVSIKTDGNLIKENGKLKVEGASEATLYLSAATNYKNYKDISNNPHAIVDDIFHNCENKTFEELKEAHIADYQKLFNRFEINLGQNNKKELPTNKRLELFNDSAGDPGLIALYVQYGRYLMLASSREGTRPANLQGIWNDQLIPPWDSKYTTNINCEMNYWLPEVTNLPECHEPLFKLIEDVAESGKITAKEHYNANGWIVHHNTDIWRGTAPIFSSTHGIFLGGGGWLAHHFWEHYLFTQDKEFLKHKAYPLMKQSALFYNDMLIKDPKTGWLVSSPSNSPETGGLVYGPAMDHQIIRSLFKACIEASKILSFDDDFTSVLTKKLPHIAPDQIGKYKQLQEWVEDKDDINSKHRHVSHLWGVYPGKEINWRDNPELMMAAIQSLKYRGDDGTGWSLAWKINFWARFLDGDHAYNMIKMIFRPVVTDQTSSTGGGSYSNLFDAHPPFQIDGNFGAPAGILEMLLQSHMGQIDILPALPSALPKGNINGICARGGFELSFSWQEGKLQKIEILSKVGNPCKVAYNGKVIEFETERGGTYKLDGALNHL